MKFPFQLRLRTLALAIVVLAVELAIASPAWKQRGCVYISAFPLLWLVILISPCVAVISSIRDKSRGGSAIRGGIKGGVLAGAWVWATWLILGIRDFGDVIGTGYEAVAVIITLLMSVVAIGAGLFAGWIFGVFVGVLPFFKEGPRL